MEFYSTIKKKELLIHTTWVYFKISRLSDGSQTEKESILFDSIYINSRTCKLIYNKRKQVRVAWGQKWRRGGLQRGTRKFWGGCHPPDIQSRTSHLGRI